MKYPKLFDVIALKVALPQHGLSQGVIGTVVDVYEDGNCEVEFANEEGETIALLALSPDEFVVTDFSTDEKPLIPYVDTPSNPRVI